MTIRACIVAVLAVASLAAGAGAAAAPPSKAAAADSTAHARAAVKPAAQPASGARKIRTIDAINIEGEIAVPQVLFITSRDNRRYRDGLGKGFRMGTLDVARSLAMPKRLCVAGQSGLESIKEE